MPWTPGNQIGEYARKVMPTPVVRDEALTAELRAAARELAGIKQRERELREFLARGIKGLTPS